MRLISKHSTVAALVLVGLLVPADETEARARNRAYRKQTVRVYDRSFDRPIRFATPTGGTISSIEDFEYTVYQLNSEHYWKMDDHWALLVDIPYVVYDSKSFQTDQAGFLRMVDRTDSGLRDIVITPIYWLESPELPGGGQFIRAQFRLNVGEKSLTRDQQLALNTIREGGLGYFYSAHQVGGAIQSLFSQGFTFSLDQNWSWKIDPGKFFDFSASYTYSGSYRATADIPARVTPHDRVDLKAMYRHRQGRKRQISGGVRTRLYTDAKVRNVRFDSLAGSPNPPLQDIGTGNEFIPGERPDVGHDTDYDLVFELSTIHNPRSASNLGLSYTFPGDLDLVNPEARVIRDITPGEALFARYTRSYKRPSGWIFSGGLSGGIIDPSFLSGIQVPGTDRDLISAVIGASKSTKSGHFFTASADVGLTVDTPNIIGNLIYQFSW